MIKNGSAAFWLQVDTAAPHKQKARYPGVASSLHINVDNEELLAEHEKQQNEAEALWAEQVSSPVLLRKLTR